MGMTIDEALNYMPCLMEACSHCLVRGCDKPIEKIEEVKIVAIDTMRKYQKIEQIIQEWRDSGFGRGQLYEVINGVLKDENVN